MLNLYFGNVYAVLALVLVLGLSVFAVFTIKSRNSIVKWEGRIWLFLLLGTALSALSAIRDGFAASNALFVMNSLQAILCSLAGGIIFLAAVVSIFLNRPAFRKCLFGTMSVLFLMQVLVIETSRIALL